MGSHYVADVAGRLRCSLMVESGGEETLVITQEVSKQARSERIDLGGISDRVRARVAQMHGLSLQRLVLVRSGQVPKTSSGKVRRGECRRLYLETELKLFGDGISSHFEALPEPASAEHRTQPRGQRCLKSAQVNSTR